jgi:hypothetical protein
MSGQVAVAGDKAVNIHTFLTSIFDGIEPWVFTRFWVYITMITTPSHASPWRRRQQGPPKYWYTITSLHVVTTAEDGRSNVPRIVGILPHYCTASRHSTLKKEASRSSETLVYYNITIWSHKNSPGRWRQEDPKCW